jgi:hypothetical protein
MTLVAATNGGLLTVVAILLSITSPAVSAGAQQS